MKKFVLLIILFTAFFCAQAQDTTKVNVMGRNIVTVNEGSDKTEVGLMDDQINVQDNYNSDTTTIRVGSKNIEIIEKGGTTQIEIERDENWRDLRADRKVKSFNGHWAGIELGINSFYDEDYSSYAGNDFMDLDYPNSMEVNINFLESNIALLKGRIGIVTGMGWSIKNYKFDNPYTIDKINGIIRPIPIESNNLKKTKLTVSYLTVPLLLECQIPVNNGLNEFFISGGVIGGLNLGSHTKIKTKDSKSKDHGSFNINPFQYSLAGRIGFKNVSIYGTYSLAPLFKDEKGPEVFPFSIGLSLVNF